MRRVRRHDAPSRTGKADRIRSGSFELTTGMTLDDAVEVLTTPPPKVPTVELAIPEGYRLTQIADKVEKDLGSPPSGSWRS